MRGPDQHAGRGRSRGAFTLIELLVVIAMIALLISILLPALAAARRSARTAVCQANMRSMGQASATYAGDYRDEIFRLSWEPNAVLDNIFAPARQTGELGPGQASEWIAATDQRAAQLQTIFLIKEGHGVTEPWPEEAEVSFHPHHFYSHLVLSEYMTGQIDEPAALCPEDIDRLDLRADAWEIVKDIQIVRRNRHQSSYQVVPATYSADSIDDGSGAISQNGSVFDTSFLIQGEGFVSTQHANTTRYNRARFYDEVTYFSSKVHMMDNLDRHNAPDPKAYFDPDARQPLLFFDGAVSSRATADANPGFDPHNPNSPEPMYWGVEGRENEFPGYYRYTRAGLQGIDFDGTEIVARGAR